MAFARSTKQDSAGSVASAATLMIAVTVSTPNSIASSGPSASSGRGRGTGGKNRLMLLFRDQRDQIDKKDSKSADGRKDIADVLKTQHTPILL